MTFWEVLLGKNRRSSDPRTDDPAADPVAPASHPDPVQSSPAFPVRVFVSLDAQYPLPFYRNRISG